ncbi:hypothetical protein IYY11_13095 [Methylocystis sp. H62]|uniref:ApeA N-terminal domain 1-containing protein n=1 Tax=Methylocystis sp. H62 TaxID=2785789 RepID=UPI0018C21706|nr:HEPN domain-containing protein [Methylocystis sp. H62]MBG0794294.1 hypothetical protein [Methylocystis sp. H62]
MTILNERGLFWWHHDPIPEKHFAPDSSVAGLLKIHDDGRTTLELDGCLTRENGIKLFLGQDDAWLDGKQIQGILKGTNNHVLLSELSRYGGRYGSGLSYENYFAAECLLSDLLTRPFKHLAFKEFEINLEGFEGWLRLGSIKIIRNKSSLSVRHQVPKQVNYTLEGGAKLKIKFGILAPIQGSHKDNKLELQESATLVYSQRTTMVLNDVKRIFNSLDDLFTLLTDSEYPLAWPSVLLKIKSMPYPIKFKFYFVRIVDNSDPPSPPESHTCPTNFLQLRDRFGEIVSRWLSKKEKIGSGFYLYTGLRRGMRLYTEHQFVSLVWGLESFHRSTEFTRAPLKKLEDKIARILQQITCRRDREWAKRQLRAEPSLEARLFEVLSTVKIDMSPDKLRIFCCECAKRRNDLSHFGAPQDQDVSPPSFYEDLQKKIGALSILYHLLILTEIGIEEDSVRSWVNQGFRSYRIKNTLIEAGLLHEDTMS